MRVVYFPVNVGKRRKRVNGDHLSIFPEENVMVDMWPGKREPLSPVCRPRQLSRLTSEAETMLEDAVSRLAPLIPAEDIYVVTGTHLADPLRAVRVGAQDLVVVTGDAALIIPKDRAQDVTHAAAELKRRNAKQV